MSKKRPQLASKPLSPEQKGTPKERAERATAIINQVLTAERCAMVVEFQQGPDGWIKPVPKVEGLP